MTKGLGQNIPFLIIAYLNGTESGAGNIAGIYSPILNYVVEDSEITSNIASYRAEGSPTENAAIITSDCTSG